MLCSRAERRALQEQQRNEKALRALSPTFACELMLVRHGETSWNVEHRLQVSDSCCTGIASLPCCNCEELLPPPASNIQLPVTAIPLCLLRCPVQGQMLPGPGLTDRGVLQASLDPVLVTAADGAGAAYTTVANRL
jgi:hypothetical protein